MKLKFLFVLSVLVFALHSCSKDEPKVEVNNPPSVQAKEVNIEETATPGQKIAEVSASDLDGDTLQYSINGDAGPFVINKDSGVITLGSGQSLDFNTTSTYTITVSVTDGTDSATATVTINVTKEEEAINQPPQINSQGFQTSELSTSADLLYTVVVINPDGVSLEFEIIENDNGLFTINNDGQIKLAEGQSLDFESQESHQITITVSDGKETLEAIITIAVGNEIESLFEDPDAFILTFETTQADEEIQVGIDPYLSYDYTIDWGDGTIDEIITSMPPAHTFASPGEHTIAIKGDQFPRIVMYNNPSADKLIRIDQWGSNAWQSLASAFRGCEILEYLPDDNPNLENITSTASMFDGAEKVNGAVSSWDMSNVTNMNLMFYGANQFDQDLGNWDISSVTAMIGMLDNSGLSEENYESALIGWASQGVNEDVSVGALGLTYCSSESIAARQDLINIGWIFTGDEECPQ